MVDQKKNSEVSTEVTTTRFTDQDIFDVERAVSQGYHERTDYPPFNINVFYDRFDFEQYIYRVMREMTVNPEMAAERNRLLVVLRKIDRMAQGTTSSAANVKSLWSIRQEIHSALVDVT